MKSIGDGAFSNCTKLKSVTISNGVTSIGILAFASCTALESITIPDNVENIGSSAFGSCTKLKSVTIGNGVISIGGSAFTGCTSLESITIPDNVESIGNLAFRNCTALQNVTMGNGVTSIGDDAFSNCSVLKKVDITDITAWCKISFGTSNANPLCCAGNLYLSGTLVTDLTIPDNVTSIGSSAFFYCTSLKSVTIGNVVTSIGDGAFLYCTSLQTVAMGNGVESIENDAFAYCTALQAVTMGSGVTSIGSSAFYGCTSLMRIGIPDGVESIGGYTFAYCTALESITIPDSVTSIGYDAFYNCTALQTVTMGSGIKNIGQDAFYNCTALTSVYYAGSAENWSKISIDNSNNTNLTNAARYYYSATKPVVKNVYWYYSDGGAVKIWDEEIVYDNSSVAGKTFTFSSCTVEVADWYWDEIKTAANNNELPGDDWAVNMVKNANSKTEYEAAYAEYIAGVEKDGYIKFEDDTFSVADNIYINISSQKYVVVDGYVYSYPDGTLITDVPKGNTFTIFYAIVISGKTPIIITSVFTCETATAET